MSRILLIGRNAALLDPCAVKLRWLGHKATIHNDLMDGLRELQMFGVDCIAWHVDAAERNRRRKLDAIKRYHRHTPLIIIENNKDADGEKSFDAKAVILSDNPGAQKILHAIIDSIPTQPPMPEYQGLEELEKEYGFVD